MAVGFSDRVSPNFTLGAGDYWCTTSDKDNSRIKATLINVAPEGEINKITFTATHTLLVAKFHLNPKNTHARTEFEKYCQANSIKLSLHPADPNISIVKSRPCNAMTFLGSINLIFGNIHLQETTQPIFSDFLQTLFTYSQIVKGPYSNPGFLDIPFDLKTKASWVTTSNYMRKENGWDYYYKGKGLNLSLESVRGELCEINFELRTWETRVECLVNLTIYREKNLCPAERNPAVLEGTATKLIQYFAPLNLDLQTLSHQIDLITITARNIAEFKDLMAFFINQLKITHSPARLTEAVEHVLDLANTHQEKIASNAIMS